MDIVYREVVLKQIKKLPKSELKKIVSKIDRLAQNPKAGKLLRGELSGIYSLRVWPYRILYEYNDKVLTICSIAHRQSVYK